MEKPEKYYIVSCSGASNTGKFTDEVARQLTSKGEANMICLAKIAMGDQNLIHIIKHVIETQKKKVVVLDGCSTNCAQILLEREGITHIIHINTTKFGIIKGETPYSIEKANEIIDYIRKSVKD